MGGAASIWSGERGKEEKLSEFESVSVEAVLQGQLSSGGLVGVFYGSPDFLRINFFILALFDTSLSCHYSSIRNVHGVIEGHTFLWDILRFPLPHS